MGCTGNVRGGEDRVVPQGVELLLLTFGGLAQRPGIGGGDVDRGSSLVPRPGVGFGPGGFGPGVD